MSPIQREMFPPQMPDDPDFVDIQQFAAKAAAFAMGLPSMKDRACENCGVVQEKMNLCVKSDGSTRFYCWDCSVKERGR